MKRTISVLIISIGIILIVSPLIFFTYSHIYQHYILLNDKPQIDKERVEGEEEFTVADTAVPPQELSPMRPPFNIIIPKISVEAVVVEGVEENNLRKGPGLYPQGSLPGEEGNTAIAGHRNTYGRWFYDLDKLQEGDKILLSSDRRTIEYEVEKSFIVKRNDWSVIDPTPYKALTLTTCNLPDAKERRFIVRARQINDLIIEN